MVSELLIMNFYQVIISYLQNKNKYYSLHILLKLVLICKSKIHNNRKELLLINKKNVPTCLREHLRLVLYA